MPQPDPTSLPLNPAPGQASRRDFDRYALDRPGRLTEIDQFGNPGATWKVRVVDLSRGGVGIRSRRMVHLGRMVMVELDTAEPGRCKLLYGVVRQSRYAEGEGYAVGVQLRAIPQSTSIRAWMTANGLAA